jgi:hypothetical protein
MIPYLVRTARIVGDQIAGLENIGGLVDLDSQCPFKNESIFEPGVSDGGI